MSVSLFTGHITKPFLIKFCELLDNNYSYSIQFCFFFFVCILLCYVAGRQIGFSYFVYNKNVRTFPSRDLSSVLSLVTLNKKYLNVVWRPLHNIVLSYTYILFFAVMELKLSHFQLHRFRLWHLRSRSVYSRLVTWTVFFWESRSVSGVGNISAVTIPNACVENRFRFDAIVYCRKREISHQALLGSYSALQPLNLMPTEWFVRIWGCFLRLHNSGCII